MKIKKIIFLLMLAAIVMVIPGPEQLGILTGNTKATLTLVIDAGHGGPDGGAEAADGTVEADLNLAIAKALKAEGDKRGIKIIMTRDSCDGLYTEDNVEKKWSKLEDMKCRKKTMEISKADAALSIHMNCFYQDTNVRGAQAFYPKSGNAEILQRSEALSECIQKHLVQGLRDGSNRVHMGKGDVYLLENPTVPIVLIECGFLSNPEDLSRLKQKKYQEKIAVCILDGVVEQMKI